MQIIRETCVLTLLFATAVFCQGQTTTGSWTLTRSDTPGKVHFFVEQSANGHQSNHSSDWNLSDFSGVDWNNRAKHDVQFAFSHDAGRIDAEGFLRDGQGAGIFTFTPNPQYVQQLNALGFSGAKFENLFNFALFDVSLAFARGMRAAKLDHLDADKLVALRIFHVDTAFIQSLRAEGLDVHDADKLVAFRIHGVTPEFVRGIYKLGYSSIGPDQWIAMRIHRVTPEYVAEMKARGLQNLSVDKLITMRIHGID